MSDCSLAEHEDVEDEVIGAAVPKSDNFNYQFSFRTMFAGLMSL
jgi:hypothetical protein